MSTTQAGVPGIVYREGVHFIFYRGAQLPPFCVKCGEPATTNPLKKEFRWHHPLLYLMILFPGLLIYAIVALIIQKKMTLLIPVCEAHLRRYRALRRAGIAMMVSGIPLMILLIVLLPDATGWAVALGTLDLRLGAVVFAVGDGILKPKYLDDRSGKFKGAVESFLVRLPQQPAVLG
jgi:hypothetical protein